MLNDHGVELPADIYLLIKKCASLVNLGSGRSKFHKMTLETKKEHMIAENNAREISKKIFGITDHTNLSTFSAKAKYRTLQLEVHPDKASLFCDKHNIPELHNEVLHFFTQATAALPMVYKIVESCVNGDSLTPPVPAPPASDGDTPMSREENLSSSQPGGKAFEEGFFSYLID